MPEHTKILTHQELDDLLANCSANTPAAYISDMRISLVAPGVIRMTGMESTITLGLNRVDARGAWVMAYPAFKNLITRANELIARLEANVVPEATVEIDPNARVN